MDDPSPSIFRFSAFELDLKTGELRKAGRLVHLPPQPFKILAMLAGQAGELVTREEIQAQIWGSETFVDFEKGLNFAIRKIRTALGDDAVTPRYIETLTRRGYRFIGTVETVGSNACSSRATDGPGPVVPISQGIKELKNKLPVRTGLALVRAPASEPMPLEATVTAMARRPTMDKSPGRGGRSRAIIVASGALVLLIGLLPGFWRIRSSGDPRHWNISSLAVLPLVDLSSSQTDQEYLADIMTDELIGGLAEIRSLRVISWTSVQVYKGKHEPVHQIGQELDVNAVVEGTVQRSGNGVVIRVRLVQTKPENVLWEKTYQDDSSDHSTMKSEVVLALADEIRMQLTAEEKQRVVSSICSSNSEARDSYSMARYQWNKRMRSPGSLEKGVEYFKEAITKDPQCARAYAGLAQAYAVFADYEVGAPSDSYPRAEEYARKAIEIDDQLGEAHAALAKVNAEYEWDWPGAQREFQRAIELSPRDSTIHQWYSEYLLRIKQFDQALSQIKSARDLERGSHLIQAEVGATLYWAGRYDEAIGILDKAIDMEPDAAYAHSWRGFAYEQKNKRLEAIGEFEKAVSLSAGAPFFKAALGHAYGLGGQSRKALAIAEELKALSHRHYVSPFDIALVYAGLYTGFRETRDKDQALQWLQRGFDEHDPGLDLLAVEPALNSLRSDPRFQKLLQSMRLPL